MRGEVEDEVEERPQLFTQLPLVFQVIPLFLAPLQLRPFVVYGIIPRQESMRSYRRSLRLSFRSLVFVSALVGLGCGGDSTGNTPQPTSIVFIGSNTLTGTV